MKRLLAGLQVLIRYDPGGYCCAEHDKIFASAINPEKISDEDLKILDENGWNFGADGLERWYKFT